MKGGKRGGIPPIAQTTQVAMLGSENKNHLLLLFYPLHGITLIGISIFAF